MPGRQRVKGLDEITGGGLPAGRPTLVCGNAGCVVTFEETAAELAENVATLGFDLGVLTDGRRLHIDHVQVERPEIEEAGPFDSRGCS